MNRDPQSVSSPSWSPSRGSSWRARLRPKLQYLLISLAVLVLDQWTKGLVEEHLQKKPLTVIPGLLDFTYVRNTGVAFGLFAAGNNAAAVWTLTALGLAALLFVVYYFSIVPRQDRLLLVALALILGGAVGNLLDRIVHWGVTDFIDFYYGTYHWHTFNVADSAITVGIALMILSSFRHHEAEEVPASSSPTGP